MGFWNELKEEWTWKASNEIGLTMWPSSLHSVLQNHIAELGSFS